MQVLVNILDLGANMQAAGDMARFSHDEVSNTLTLESELNTLVGTQLAMMGHHIVVAPNGSAAGGYQGIMYVPDSSKTDVSHGEKSQVSGYYRAGSQFREDGVPIGW
jgi:gamma-glutamyltranspeptidase